MTPDQALSILDAAASMAALSRQDHMRVVEALQALKEFITPPAEAPKDD